jgi:hypothetical protein
MSKRIDKTIHVHEVVLRSCCIWSKIKLLNDCLTKVMLTGLVALIECDSVPSPQFS